MFSELISKRETLFTDDVADAIFCPEYVSDRIQCFGEDYCSRAVLRCLITPRQNKEENKTIGLKLMRSQYGYPREYVTDAKNEILIAICSGRGSEEAMNELKRYCEENNYSAQEDLAKFAEAFMKLHVMTNKEKRSTVVITNQYTPSNIHFVTSVTPRLVPWLFEDAPVTEDEREMLRALAKSEKSEFINKINKIADVLNFREDYLKGLIVKFASSGKKRLLNSRLDDLTEVIDKMNDLLHKYNDYCQRRDSLNCSIVGLRDAIARNECINNDLNDFLEANKKAIKPLYMRGSQLTFEVYTNLNNFDPEIYERYRDSKNSGWMNRLYQRCKVECSEEEFQKMLDLIFVDETLVVRMSTQFNIDQPSCVSVNNGQNCADQTYIENPHHFKFACLGQWGGSITESLADGDLTEALNKCVCSAGTINIAEDVTMLFFIEQMTTKKEKFIYNKKTGELMNVMDVIDEIRKGNF